MGLLNGSVSIRGARVLRSRLSTPERIFNVADDAARYELEPSKCSTPRDVVPLPLPPALPSLTEPISVLLTPQRRTTRLAPPVTPLREAHPSPEAQRQIRFAENPAVDTARTMRKRCVHPSTLHMPLSTPRPSHLSPVTKGKCERAAGQPMVFAAVVVVAVVDWTIGPRHGDSYTSLRPPSASRGILPARLAVRALFLLQTCRPFPFGERTRRRHKRADTVPIVLMVASVRSLSSYLPRPPSFPTP